MDLPGVNPISATEPRPPVGPDWSSIQDQICCPLCDYNLRGLTEPRCPECGHQFIWSQLLDVNNRIHPWLFEHRNRGKLRALLHTFSASQTPWRFWRTVRPFHTVRASRLLLYWVTFVLVTAVPAIGIRYSAIAKYYIELPSQRQQLSVYVERALKQNNPQTIAVVKKYGSVSALVKERLPLLPSSALLVWSRRGTMVSVFSRTVFYLWLVSVLWPWLTLLGLLIFEQSMRKAQIKKAHMLRCAIYSTDLCCLLSIPVAWLMSSNFGMRTSYSDGGFFPVTALVFPAALAGMIAWKLTCACRRYLNLPHALGVSLACQAIVLLCLMIMAPWRWVY